MLKSCSYSDGGKIIKASPQTSHEAAWAHVKKEVSPASDHQETDIAPHERSLDEIQNRGRGER